MNKQEGPGPCFALTPSTSAPAPAPQSRHSGTRPCPNSRLARSQGSGREPSSPHTATAAAGPARSPGRSGQPPPPIPDSSRSLCPISQPRRPVSARRPRSPRPERTESCDRNSAAPQSPRRQRRHHRAAILVRPAGRGRPEGRGREAGPREAAAPQWEKPSGPECCGLSTPHIAAIGRKNKCMYKI